MPNQFPGKASSPDSSRKGKGVLTTVLMAAVALAMGFGIWSLSRQLAPELISELESPEAAAMAVIPEKGIAVLPFENLSEDQRNAFLADGVQDDIRTTLAKVADLKVINRTSVNTYPAGTQRNMRRIAQTLGVAYALEGSVRQTGEKVSITVTADRCSDWGCCVEKKLQRRPGRRLCNPARHRIANYVSAQSHRFADRKSRH